MMKREAGRCGRSILDGAIIDFHLKIFVIFFFSPAESSGDHQKTRVIFSSISNPSHLNLIAADKKYWLLPARSSIKIESLEECAEMDGNGLRKKKKYI